ncbi:MAG: exodeoxyribonuclease V subunit gamma, partial [Actinomycetia bacterium]|nr:exodeoxyribonuclease V subunit gamma [Actinomycetes bacterium]
GHDPTLSPVEHPARRHRRVVAALRARAGSPPAAAGPGLPPRVGVLALTPLAADDEEFLEALAGVVPTSVYRYAPLVKTEHPDGFAARYAPLAQAAPRGRRLAFGPGDEPPSLLAQVQDDIRHQRHAAPGVARHADGSLQIHACHGPDRQVEVLRDLVCGLLADDPSLEPRDILVLCTDLETFAPLIEAAFSPHDDPLSGGHPGRRLRARVAANTLRLADPVLDRLAWVLRLPQGRASAQDLLELCQTPWVAATFGFGPDDLARLPDLIGTAGIVWGLDAAHRGDAGLPDIREGTWLHGVQRLHAGLALPATPGDPLGGLTPAQDLDNADLEVIGALSELVSRVRLCRHDCATPATATQWADRLSRCLALLFTPPSDDASALDHARFVLSGLTGAGAGDGLLSLDDLLVWLPRWSSAPRGRPAYDDGSLLFTRLGDLAAVSFRVVCVLALDDDRFPPRRTVLGDDLSASLPSHDRSRLLDDPRALGRTHLCEALLAARDRFIVVTQGASPLTNEPLAPSVPVLDLLEACAVDGEGGAWHPSRDDALADAIVRYHPAQPYAPDDFTPVGHGPTFSFDAEACAGAQRAQLPPEAPPAALWRTDFAPADEGAPIAAELDDLARFMRNPADELLRETAHLRLARWTSTARDQLIGPGDPLLTWRLGDAILTDLLAGSDPEAARTRARLTPGTPPGWAGASLVDRVAAEAASIARQFREIPWRPQPVPIRIGSSSCRLTGQVQADGHRLAVCRFGWIQASHLVDTWIRLLGLAVAHPDGPPPIAVLVGKGPLVGLVAPPPEEAWRLLAQTATLRQAGLRRLVPLPLRTGHDFVAPATPGARPDDSMRLARARQAWTGGGSPVPGEAADPAWAMFFAGTGFDDLLAVPPDPDDPAPATGLEPDGRFARLAAWWWRPLVAASLPVRDVQRRWREVPA